MILEPFESEIGILFRSIVPSTNLMTPGIQGYVHIIDGIAEVSYGHFRSFELWGVTCIINNEQCSKLSKSFDSLKEVEEYINKLGYESLDPLQNLLIKLNIK